MASSTSARDAGRAQRLGRGLLPPSAVVLEHLAAVVAGRAWHGKENRCAR